jgi:hypothetical protein
MTGHTCTAFRNFWITLTNRNQVFSALVALSFSTHNSALISDITVVKNNITRMTCCRQPEEVRGRDDYTLKNITKVVEFFLSLPGTNAAAGKVFSLVNALWTDERSQKFPL